MMIELTGFYPKQYYPDRLRFVRYWDEEQKREFVFLTNAMTIKDVFLRNSDDCIAVYGHRGAFYGDVHNIAVKNSILWADKAHPINIGVHGEDDKEKNIIENLTFHNIDILEQKESLVAAQGCMAIT